MSLLRIHGRKSPVRRHPDLQGTSDDPRMCRIYPGDAPPIPFSDATASSGKLSSAAARFSRRWPRRTCRGSEECWARGEGARRARPASAWRRGARDLGQGRRLQRSEAAERKKRHIGECRRGRDRRSGHRRRDAPDCSDSARRRSRRCVAPSAICAGVTLLKPIWRTSPCCCSSASTVSGASIDPSAGPWIRRRRAGCES